MDEQTVIDNAMIMLTRLGGQNTKLIVRDHVYDIRTAMADYRPDLVTALDNSIVFGDVIPDEDGPICLAINLVEIHAMTQVDFPSEITFTINYRASQRCIRSRICIQNIIDIIYNVVKYLEVDQYD